MKLKSFLAIAISGVVVSSCSLNQMVKLAEEQELTVTPSPLEVHGDSVKFDVSAVLPVKMLKKNKLYSIETYYTYGDPTQSLNQFEFDPVEFPNQKVEQPSKTQSYSMFYEDAMESGELKIKGIASNLEKTKYKETPELKVADGIITTSRLVKYAYDVAYAPHGYNNQEELIPTKVIFQFDKGSSKLKSSEIKGEAGQELDAFIAAKNVTRTVSIYGSHSPEGLESINSKLAEDRAKVIKDFYYKKMKQYDYKNLADSIKFETIAIFQKWDKFLSIVDTTPALSAEDKADIRNIVTGAGSFEEKEKQLASKAFYKTLTKEVYPELRISRTEILSVKKKKTDAEINVLTNNIINGKANIDTLSYEEFMFGATLTPVLEEKNKVYELAAKKYDTWEAHNNLGATYLALAKKATDDNQKAEYIDKALAQLEVAANQEESAIIYNNLGACYLQKGKRAEAKKAFSTASSAKGFTEEVKLGVNAGKGSLEIREGNYPSAISMLKKTDENNADALFNLGLAYLVSKDYTNAEQALGAAIYVDKSHALAYYCKAIAAARQDKLAEIKTNLAEAVKIDGSLRDKAIGDLEFQKYWENAEFIGALK